MKDFIVQTLGTERLILRPLQSSDAPCIYKHFANDAKVTQYLTWQPHANVQETQQTIQKWIDNQTNTFAIELKSTHEVIGTIDTGHLDARTKSCEIGYVIGRQYWNQGYMTEAFSRLLDYLFDEVGLNRVRADCDARNKASSAVMKKCGLRLEACKRQDVWTNAGIGDREIYAILKMDLHPHHFYS